MNINIPKNANAAKLEALKAARNQGASSSDASIQKWVSPDQCKDRIRVIFDDSGSMHGQIKDAKDGVTEFYRNCIPNQTAVAVHMLCTSDSKLEALTTNLIEAATVLKDTPPGLGGTPLFSTMKKAFEREPRLTRMVVFSDGEPTDSWDKESWNNWNAGSTEPAHPIPYGKDADKAIAAAKELRVPIDTVFFGSDGDHTAAARKFLKYLSDQTGGYFLHFDPKKVNFRTAFKYLAPVNRLMLASENFRKEVEDGTRA